MGLSDIARRDFADITGNTDEFGVPFTLTAPDDTELETAGYSTVHNLDFSMSGEMVNARKAYVSVAESKLADASYPYRDTSGRIAMQNHKVDTTDANGTVLNWIVKEFYPDETLGNIVLILGKYE